MILGTFTGRSTQELRAERDEILNEIQKSSAASEGKGFMILSLKRDAIIKQLRKRGIYEK